MYFFIYPLFFAILMHNLEILPFREWLKFSSFFCIFVILSAQFPIILKSCVVLPLNIYIFLSTLSLPPSPQPPPSLSLCLPPSTSLCLPPLTPSLFISIYIFFYKRVFFTETLLLVWCCIEGWCPLTHIYSRYLYKGTPTPS